jgi:hypothetical protein
MAPVSGSVHAFYLFDVAEGVDLSGVRRFVGEAAAPATLSDKAPGPPRVYYIQPPLVVPGEAFGLAEIAPFTARVKFYDYGVVSLMLSRPFEGAWDDLVRLGQELIENEPLEEQATALCQTVVDRVRPALKDARGVFLREDYLAFVVHAAEDGPDAETMLEQHGADIAQMVRGERQALSRQEREEVLRHQLSYLTADVVVPAYNAAFVFDTASGAVATLEILEFVNSQLLEFRFYDDLLESELARIYAGLQGPRMIDRLIGRRFTRAARRLQALYVEVNELTDRLENAVKLVGDLYLARLFGLAAARLGLDRWKRNVEEKLNTLNDIYRFAVEQTGMAQGNLLELVIVLILIIEFVMLLGS